MHTRAAESLRISGTLRSGDHHFERHDAPATTDDRRDSPAAERWLGESPRGDCAPASTEKGVKRGCGQGMKGGLGLGERKREYACVRDRKRDEGWERENGRADRRGDDTAVEGGPVHKGDNEPGLSLLVS